jgi:N6-L-threonylcarbamoyladenine synthase
MKPVVILAIESSCDETSAAVCVDGTIASNIIATQQIHEQYGGVVPELASRAHMQHIVPTVQAAMEEAGMDGSQISGVAFTQAPGLIGSLLVGAQFAKSLSLAWQVPLLAVHHMQAHVLANLLLENKPTFPFLCLTVSGGHTQIVLCKSPLSMQVIGETIDDAAGEAFDKAAKLLGLPYPGGPLIDKYATEGNAMAFKFAKPNVPDLNYSFSGFKTSVLYFLQQQTQLNPLFIEQNLADLCASVQATIIDILLQKLVKAAKQTGVKNICLAGGVSANKGLRAAIELYGKKYHWQTFVPPFEYCTDNAAMIAITGYYKFLENKFSPLQTGVEARAVW